MGGSCGMVSGGAVSNGMVGDSGEARVASWWPGAGPAILLTSAASAMILVHLFAAVSAYDDAYITFRYVRNFVGGRGAVFNAGERIFGISKNAPKTGLSLGVTYDWDAFTPVK